MGTVNQKDTYNSSASNARDVDKCVTNISPQGTPLFNAIGQTVARARFHEFVTDVDAAAADNAMIEGATFENTAIIQRGVIGNWCQIFRKVIDVSETQEEIEKLGGVQSEVKYQTQKAMRELAKDIERAFCVGATASGNGLTANASARYLGGCTSLVTTATCATAASATEWAGTGSANLILFENKLNDWLEQMWDVGEVPTQLFCEGTIKRRISALTAGSTKNTESKDKKLINTISVYESEFGVHKVSLERYCPDTYLIGLTPSYFATAYLRRIKPVNLAKTTDSTRVALVGELTFDVKNFLALGVMKSA